MERNLFCRVFNEHFSILICSPLKTHFIHYDGLVECQEMCEKQLILDIWPVDIFEVVFNISAYKFRKRFIHLDFILTLNSSV